METGLFVLILGGGLAMLALRLHHSAAERKAAREGYFDLVAQGMSRLRRAIAPTGFARVSGDVAGMEVDLQAVPDTLTWRKLPALWLLVTVPGALPLRQRIDLMIRPRGVEPFSGFADLPHQTWLPKDFPEDAALRSEEPLSPEEGALLRRHLAIFDDPRVKELILGPTGLRITWLADEAERGRYLIFREAEMGRIPLAPEDLAPLLDRLAALREDILQDDQARKCA
ncbi:hypothetical protein [Pseudogemmobacter humi]|uniref:DUF3137 domain-containing protein n=1 Tax=Pseudogemmobacter humi TaxID=2483812 RepID=A0A3P5X9I7_9RHOB|nr:hypothetical protein [Pseudogemmobacter humi]VDC31158.1 hypothetical protein XINFAN_02767 [Pseudogemmobacter humi]